MRCTGCLRQAGVDPKCVAVDLTCAAVDPKCVAVDLWCVDANLTCVAVDPKCVVLQQAMGLYALFRQC